MSRLSRLPLRTLALAAAAAIGVLGLATQGRAQDQPTAPAADKPGGIPADTEVKTTPSGLQYCVLTAGKEGRHPKLGDRVKVHYTGWLTNGSRFDGSRDKGGPATFTVGGLVPGWNEALALMTVGAHWKLTIPPNLGYGDRGSPPTIPAKATLIFELELVELLSMPDFCSPNPAAQTKTASGLKFEVVAEGKGEPAAAGDVVEMKYAFWNSKGDLIDCTERTGGTIKARRDDMTLAFMKEATTILRPGARLRFEVPPDLCFGAQMQDERLPANTTTIWELELVGVIKPLPVPPFVLPDDSKVTTTKSGLKYEVIEAGEGTPPKMLQMVKVHYAGWLVDGSLFDSSFSRGEEMEMQLGRVIPGWNEGLQLMKPGAVYRFVIPPALAYGARQVSPKIPPNSTLVFWVKLVKVL